MRTKSDEIINWERKTTIKIPVSVIILTKNESRGIAAAVVAVAEFDEVIVVDSSSDDGTAQIAEANGARVIQFQWDGRLPKKKQWALDHSAARYSWVLLLDADEYPSPQLTNEIRALFANGASPACAVYELTLSYKYSGRFLQHGHRVVKQSLIDTRLTRFPDVQDLDLPGIREVEGHYQPLTRGTLGSLRGTLCHNDVDPVRTWFERHNRYSDWEAHLRQDDILRKSVAAVRSRKGQLFDRLPFKPITFFIYSFVFRQGYRDGQAGLDYAIALSMYYWQIGLKSRELARERSV